MSTSSAYLFYTHVRMYIRVYSSFMEQPFISCCNSRLCLANLRSLPIDVRSPLPILLLLVTPGQLPITLGQLPFTVDQRLLTPVASTKFRSPQCSPKLLFNQFPPPISPTLSLTSRTRVTSMFVPYQPGLRRHTIGPRSKNKVTSIIVL